MEQSLYALITNGKLVGFSEKPLVVETVISYVFIFKEANTALKIYKRNNDWWNKDMNDLSEGIARISSIRNDYAFNHHLNPDIYYGLKKLTLRGDILSLETPNDYDDELVICMRLVDTDTTMTKNLLRESLSKDDYYAIGRTLAEKKRSIPPYSGNDLGSWHEQLDGRFNDLKNWVESEKDFPEDLKTKGMSILRDLLEKNKALFQDSEQSTIYPSIDCNPENLLFSSGTLSFLDAFPPKPEWQIGTFELDIFRTGADIYGLGGKEAYEAYRSGAYSVMEKVSDELEYFYVLYGAMIDGPYFYMLAKKNPGYLTAAKKYEDFIRSLVDQKRLM